MKSLKSITDPEFAKDVEAFAKVAHHPLDVLDYVQMRGYITANISDILSIYSKLDDQNNEEIEEDVNTLKEQLRCLYQVPKGARNIYWQHSLEQLDRAISQDYHQMKQG